MLIIVIVIINIIINTINFSQADGSYNTIQFDTKIKFNTMQYKKYMSIRCNNSCIRQLVYVMVG